MTGSTQVFKVGEGEFSLPLPLELVLTAGRRSRHDWSESKASGQLWAKVQAP